MSTDGSSMRVGIVGAGAVGMLLGALLDSAPAAATMISRRASAVRAVRTSGILVRDPSDLSAVLSRSPPIVAADDVPPSLFDVVLLLNSANDMEWAVGFARQIATDDGLIVALQNGLSASRAVEDGDERGVAGACYLGGTYVESGVVDWTSRGPLVLAPRPHLLERTRLLMARVQTDHVQIAIEDDRDAVVWTKMVNAIVNSLSGALLLPVHELTRSASAWDVLDLARQEILAVAQASGVQLDRDAILANFVGRPVATHVVGSTYQSLSAHRISEVRDASGEVERLGRRHGIPTPVNTTLRLLTQAREELWAHEI